jgi:hypothetical protein
LFAADLGVAGDRHQAQVPKPRAVSANNRGRRCPAR